LPQYQTSSTRPWSSSSSQYSGHRIPDLPSFNLSTTEQQSLLPRHLQLPPLDTSLASHRPLGDQLYAVDFGHHPSKRRRAEQSHRSPSPKLVSRSILNADSSSRVNLGSERIRQQHSSPFHDTTHDHAAVATQDRLAWASRADQASRAADCCLPGCQGSSCTRLRSLVQDLVSEICTRDPHISGVPSTSEFLPPSYPAGGD